MTHSAGDTPLTPEQRSALINLGKAYLASLRAKYGLPRGASIATYVKSGNAPDELRKEWEEFTSLELSFVHELMMEGAAR